MKIAIIGNAGSGKSTLALKLHEILGLPLYYLDHYFWLPGWQQVDRATFQHIHHNLCDQPTWIIEGIARKIFDYRAQQADIIIFLDIPTYICLYRVLKRAIVDFGKVRRSSAPGCPERGPSLTFLKFVWNFNRTRKPIILDVLEKYKGSKKIFIIKNKAELRDLIQQFESNAI